MRFWLILFALLGLMLGWAFGEEPSAPTGLPLVTVELKSGRHFTAGLDPRSSAGRLWIRFGTPTLRITRPVDWDHVSRIIWQGASYTPEEFTRKLESIFRQQKRVGPNAPQPKPQATAGPAPAQAKQAAGSVPMSRWAALALGHGEAVTHIDAHARLLAGIRAGDRPRYRLVVAPRGQGMRDVPALGTLNVELWGYRRSIDQEVLLYRWTRNVTPAEYSPLGASVDLELPPGLARQWPNLAPQGRLVVQFAVAGQGVFRAEVPGVAFP